MNLKIYSHQLIKVVSFALIICLASCGKTVRFATSPITPAAEGKVKISRDKNKNYEIALNITNLADPSRLTPAKKNYIIWLNSQEDTPTNLGQLVTSSGIFSSTLKASFRTVTPIKPKRIFITAEDGSSVQSPGSVIVLTTGDF